MTKQQHTCGFLQRKRLERFPGNPIINSKVIKWHLVDYTPDMDEKETLFAFRAAFNDHLGIVFNPIKFEETSEVKDANIVINFAVNGDRDLPFPFESTTLAYAFAPVNNKSTVWFNDVYQWASMAEPRKISLMKVAVHEFLHSLGFGHSRFANDILEPTYRDNNDIIFSPDTIQEIEKAYGALKNQIRAESGDIKEFIKKFITRKYQLWFTRTEQIKILAEELNIVFTTRRETINKIREYLNI